MLEIKRNLPHNSVQKTQPEIGYSDREREGVDLIKKYKDYGKAASHSKGKFSVSNLRGITFRLRLRKGKCKDFLKEFEQDRKELGPNCTYLTDKRGNGK